VANGVLSPEQLGLPERQSRRTWLRDLIWRGVEGRGVPLYYGEIYDLSQQDPGGEGLSRHQVFVTVSSLVRTGHLRIVHRVRGIEKNLYLPAGMDPRTYTRKDAAGWLDRTEAALHTLWEMNVQEALLMRGRPKGVPTSHVRRFLTERYPDEPLPNRGWTGSALDYMSRTSPPRVRKAHRPGTRAVLWFPTDVRATEVETTQVFASDAERLREAARRALLERNAGLVRNFPVSMLEIVKVTESDDALKLEHPRATRILLAQLGDLARPSRVATGPGRKTPQLIRVGRYRRNAYFVLEDGPAHPSGAAAHVAFWNFQNVWSRMNARSRFDSASECRIPSLRIARVVLLEVAAGDLIAQIDSLLAGSFVIEEKAAKRAPITALPDRATRDEIGILREEISSTHREMAEWLRFQAARACTLRPLLQTHLEGWTLDEYRAAAKRLGSVHGSKDVRRLGSLTRDINRMPNPGYSNRSSSNPREAASLLLDPVHARMQLMIRFGGPMARRRAMLASSQLDLVRSPEILLQDLDDPSLDVRIGVLSCLAFLNVSEAGLSAIRTTAENDPIPGVRATALWAYAFLDVPGAGEFVQGRALVDRTLEVQMLLREAEAVLPLAGKAGWWKV
jgi:hypothetical protein